MKWWGMVETLAELFARHSSTDKFDGNLKGPFRASIGEEEYGVDKTPVMIGLYRGYIQSASGQVGVMVGSVRG